MPTLSAPQSATYTTAVPSEFVTVICTGANDAMQVSWSGAGGTSGQRIVRNTPAAGEDIGPLPDGTSVRFTALSGAPSYLGYAESFQSVVSGGGILRNKAASRGVAKLSPRAVSSIGLLGHTCAAAIVVPQGYYAARLIVENVVATATVGFAASMASSANVTGGTSVPTGTPAAFLWSGSGTVTLPAALSGAGTVDVAPSLTASDILQISDIPRNDGGAGRIVMVRSYVPSAGNTELSRCDSLGGPLDTLGATSFSSVTAYNGATWPALTVSNAGFGHSFSLQLFSDSYVRTLLLAGDSTFQGALLGNDMNCPAQIAALGLTQSGQSSVYVVNRGSASQTSNAYFANGVAYMAAVPVTAAAFCPFSPNDAADRYTTAGNLRMMSLAARWVAECVDRGVLPVLATPNPVSGLTSTEEGFRRAIVNNVKAMAASLGVPLVDRDSIYTDYSTATGGWKSGLNANGVHPSVAGYALEAIEWQRVIRLIP